MYIFIQGHFKFEILVLIPCFDVKSALESICDPSQTKGTLIAEEKEYVTFLLSKGHSINSKMIPLMCKLIAILCPKNPSLFLFPFLSCTNEQIS